MKDSESTATQQSPLFSGEPDPWEPWSNGKPQLRADSFTAKQLCYLTPEVMHLESRRVLIGNPPDNWVEENCRPWWAAVQQGVSRYASAEGDLHSRSLKSDALSPIENKTEKLKSEVPGPASKSASSDLPAEVQSSSSSIRAAYDAKMVAEIAKASHINDRLLSAQRKNIVYKMRHRRAHLRRKKLREAPLEVVNDHSMRPELSNTTTVEPVNSSATEVTPALQVDPATHSSRSSTSSSDRTRVPTASDSVSMTTAAESLGTTYYDCEDGTELTSKTSRPGTSGLGSSRPGKSTKQFVAIAEKPTVSIYPRHDAESVSEPKSLEQESTRTSDQESVASTSLSGMSSKLSDLKRRGKVRFSAHRHTQLVYQGRFLVEVREAASDRTVINEVDAPLATSLVSRWKEYAVFAKYTGNIRRPLCLYFYDAVKDAKLTRRAQRVWSRSLDFKVAIDSYYELKMFSPLDLTMALWRPHLGTERGRQRKRKRRIFILHSQSINGIWDLSFLLASVVQSAKIFSSRIINISVPTIDVDVKLMVNSESHRELEFSRSSTFTYEELKGSLVSRSPTLKAIMGKVWGSVRSLPRRYRVSTTDKGQKYALAWQQGPHAHRQIWVPGAGNDNYLVSRLFWLMQPCGNLHLVVPEPRCYEGDLVEPAGIEGYCNAVDTGRYGKGVNLAGKYGTQYLYTYDFLLFYTSSALAQPPMLASSQSSVEKIVNPFPLDKDGDISWIKLSTCLREIDFHDTIARLELERRISMISSARGFIDLRHVDNVVADGSVPGQLLIQKGEDCNYRFYFASQDEAESWSRRLNDLIKYWQAVSSAESVRRASGNNKTLGISPFVKNRPILYSGPVYCKKHRFTTFKRFPVILTLEGLVMFRFDGSTHVTNSNKPIPAAVYDFRKYAIYSLEDTYVYTGQLAKHALLNDDKHMDPSNPGVRALPRAYEDSWVSQDTELDRCFVIWRPRKSRLKRVLNTTGSGTYLTFLARDKHERDQWVTAIRYVQTELASKTKEEVLSQDFTDASVLDINSDMNI